MRKRGIKAVIVTLLAIAIVLTGVSDGVVPAAAAGVKLNKTSLSLVVGKSATLKVTGTKAVVKWSSANKKIATVSAKGVVKAKKVGKTNVTATVKGKKYVCKVTVKPKPNTNYTGLANWEKEELQKAVSVGILSKNLSYEFARDVTGGEFYNMLLAADKRLGLGKTRKLKLTAGEKKQTLTRQTAADWIQEMFEESLFYDYTRQHMFVGYGQDENGQWYGTKEEYDARETRWSLHNVLCYCDLTSNYPIMQTDENFCFRNEDKLTVLEAAQAAYRLTNSCMPEDDFVAFSKVDAYEPSEEVIALANAMPKVTDQSFSFRGVDLPNKGSTDTSGCVSKMYSESQVRLLAEMDCNYARLQLAPELLFSEDWKKVNQIHIKNLDEIIEHAIRYGIHVCISFYYYPEDGDYRVETLSRFWQLMAERYEKIPNNALSFNVINEPGTMWTEDGARKIDELNQALTRAVHSADTDRLVFCDGLRYVGAPTWEPSEVIAQEENCVQSFHWYGGPFNGDNMLWNGGYAPADQWPFPFIQNVLREDTPITINGEFQAGERIQVIANFVSDDSSISFTTDDGKQYMAAAKNAEKRGGKLTIFEITLEKDCKAITLRTDSWINVYELAIIHNQKTDKPVIFLEPSGFGEFPESDIKQLVTNIVFQGWGEVIPWERSITINGDGTYQVTSESPDYPLWQTDYTAEGFKDYLKLWQEFSERTGQKYMVQEFGVYCSLASYQVSCNYIKGLIEAMDELGISWSAVTWGTLVRSGRVPYNGEETIWECIEGFYVCKQLREVYQK